MTSFHFFLFPLSIFSTICLGYKLLSLNQSSVVAFYLGPFSRKLLDHCFKQLFLFFYFLAQTHLLAFHSLQNQVKSFLEHTAGHDLIVKQILLAFLQYSTETCTPPIANYYTEFAHGHASLPLFALFVMPILPSPTQPTHIYQDSIWKLMYSSTRRVDHCLGVYLISSKHSYLFSNILVYNAGLSIY